MRQQLFNILSILLLTTVFVSTVQAESYKVLEEQIEQEYGIEIEFDNIEFPEVWSVYVLKFTVVEEIMRKSTLVRLKEDLDKYRKKVLNKSLKKIYIPKTLNVNGAPLGGTKFIPDKLIYLTYNLFGDSGEAATGFHHEFSSILLFTHVFDWEQWRKLNPGNFSYAMENAPPEVLLSEGDTDLLGSPKMYKQGFVCGYGSMDMENDMNTYFQLMIGNPVKLAKLEKKYPAIHRKAEVLREFYYGVVTYPLQVTKTN